MRLLHIQEQHIFLSLLWNLCITGYLCLKIANVRKHLNVAMVSANNDLPDLVWAHLRFFKWNVTCFDSQFFHVTHTTLLSLVLFIGNGYASTLLFPCPMFSFRVFVIVFFPFSREEGADATVDLWECGCWEWVWPQLTQARSIEHDK